MPSLLEGKDFSFIWGDQRHGIPNEEAHYFSANKLETDPEEPLLMEIPEE
jgi:hypothetical protein